jgi:hypothetical protein
MLLGKGFEKTKETYKILSIAIYLNSQNRDSKRSLHDYRQPAM